MKSFDDKTLSVEERLRAATPSHRELEQRKDVKRCDELISYTKSLADWFVSQCEGEAKVGNRYCELTDRRCFKDLCEADDVVELLKSELKKKGVLHAKAHTKSHYITERVWNSNAGKYEEHKKYDGVVINISMSW